MATRPSRRAGRFRRFLPLAVQLGDEEALLERALTRLQELSAGEIGVLPEFLAWTAERSEIALAALVSMAQAHRIGIITTLNLGPEWTEDLPGREERARYDAVVIITARGDVHVPQAKVTPQAFEMSPALGGPGIGVYPYQRLNRVRVDLGDDLIEMRLLVCSDVWAFTRFSPHDLRCDLLIVPASFARGAEAHASRLLDEARRQGLAAATLHANAFHLPSDPRHAPLALPVEELREGGADKPPRRWRRAREIRDGFRLYREHEVHSYIEMADLPAREGRIAVPRVLAKLPLALGVYPVTITF